MALRPGPMAGVGVSESPSPTFWRGRRVLLSGHTGFKGAWLAAWLAELGAEVHGLALPPETAPSLFDLLGRIEGLTSHIGDIRDPAVLSATVSAAAPEIVIHMAAQALVRRSYRDPLETFDTNVMGTARLLEALRGAPGLAAIVVVTSDKVYHNPGTGVPLAESAPLGGDDPYSASKAAAELVTASYARSYFDREGVPVGTARAGNVIGGGDWSEDRIVPDIWRAMRGGTAVALRFPAATRPWQHVLEPLSGYLRYAEALSRAPEGLPRALNFGPDGLAPVTVATVVERFQAAYRAPEGWRQSPGVHPKEAPLLAVDAGLAARSINWRPRLGADAAIGWTAEWYRAFDAGMPARELTLQQIRRYRELP